MTLCSDGAMVGGALHASVDVRYPQHMTHSPLSAVMLDEQGVGRCVLAPGVFGIHGEHLIRHHVTLRVCVCRCV